MNKQKLFEELLKKKGIHMPQGTGISRRDNPGPHKLSFSQRRIWFLQQFDTSSAAYNDPTSLRIKGPLSIEILEKVLNEIIRRHPVLRMVFPSQNGEPVQVLHNEEMIKIRVTTLQDEGMEINESSVIQWVNLVSGRSFDLSAEMPVNASVLVVDSEDYILVVNIHHIVMDGWSKGIMLKELINLYEAYSLGKLSPLPEPSIRYTDYVYWHHEWMQGDLFRSQLNYWKEKLIHAAPVLELPTDFPRPGLPSGKGSLEPFSISPSLLNALQDLAKRENATLFMVLMSAYTGLLYRYTCQGDILVGTPIAGRQRTELENLIGLFVNILVIRSQLDGDLTFKTLLSNVRSTCLEAYSNQDIPFEKLVEELNPQRNLSITPLFQVMFQLQNAPMPPVKISGLTISPIQVDTGVSQVDLSLTLWEENQSMNGSFEFNTDIFLPSTIKRMTRHFLVLLDHIVRDPLERISMIPILTPEEKIQILETWNNTREDYPEDLCIYQLFDDCSRKHPDEVAVISGGIPLTYCELNKQSNSLANRLQKMGVGPDIFVAVCMDNSCELVAAIIGILKAGAAYIPMDVEYPSERLVSILNDANPSVLITQQSYLNRFSGYTGSVICLDPAMGFFSLENAETGPDISHTSHSSHAACVIFTSGSTGNPKGIIIDNRSIVNLVYSFIRSYHPGPGDRILPLTSIASASFVGEILPILTSGGAIVLADKVLFLDMKKLRKLLDEYRITILSTVPSMIARLNDMNQTLISQSGTPSLRLLLSGGEALSAGDIDRLIENVTIVNGYGLTEATVCSTYIIVNENREKIDFSKQPYISVGKPIINTQVYILDQNRNPVPVGIPGEIFISGDGLARGYINRPELTVERFILMPPAGKTLFEKRVLHSQKLLIEGGASDNETNFKSLQQQTSIVTNGILFKTGDVGAWLPDGSIKFLGRIDTQVQVHGHRVELSEIETHLGLHPDIREAVVTVVDRGGNSNDKRLAAYIVAAGEPGKRNILPGSKELREWLAKRVPDYMVPSVFEPIEAIPLNINGKVDLAALPVPSIDRPELDADYKAPQTETEKNIALIWKEFLSLERIGINDNFFDLGGHSLLLTQVHSRLSPKYSDVELSIVDLFRYPTIYLLARYIDGSEIQKQQVMENYRKIQERGQKQRQAFNRQRFKPK